MELHRDQNLDVIRATAVLFVVAVHALPYIGFYEQPCVGLAYFFASMLRVVFITCVPLFLILTGYLQNEKPISKKYYIGILRIVFSYIICGVLCQCFVMFVDHDEWSFKGALLALLDFKGAPYGWYIEMYMGLFILVPLLNILWHGLSQRQKHIVLISMVLLTAVPSVFNNFNFNEQSFLYATKESYTALFPDWWQGIYPVTYYYIGAYIKENKERICAIKHLPMIFLLQIFAGGGINYLKNYEHIFPWSTDTNYQGYQCLFVGPVIFVLLLKKRKIRFYQGIEKVSKISLEIYLISYIFDRLLYHFINLIPLAFAQKLFVIPLTVGITFTASAVTATFINWIVQRVYVFVRNIVLCKCQ